MDIKTMKTPRSREAVMTAAMHLNPGDRFFAHSIKREVTVKETRIISTQVAHRRLLSQDAHKRLLSQGPHFIRVTCECGHLTDFSHGASVKVITH